MLLEELIALHENKVLEVDKSSTRDNPIVGGTALTKEQCRVMAKSLGWTRYDKQPHEIIDKTNKFIRGIKHNLKDIDEIGDTEVSFLNDRRQNTEIFSDRIHMYCEGLFEVKILYNVPGTGSSYCIYDHSNNFSVPTLRCRTLKQVGQHISSLY